MRKYSWNSKYLHMWVLKYTYLLSTFLWPSQKTWNLEKEYNPSLSSFFYSWGFFFGFWFSLNSIESWFSCLSYFFLFWFFFTNWFLLLQKIYEGWMLPFTICYVKVWKQTYAYFGGNIHIFSICWELVLDFHFIFGMQVEEAI